MMPKQRIYSPYAHEGVALMGQLIKLGRKQRKWTEKTLAERAGISRATLQKIENGEMSCSVGSVFELATLVGIKLFESDNIPLAKQIEHERNKVALLPQRIKPKTKPIHDDF